MQKKSRDGVPLAFYDNGTSKRAFVLIHGWGCDHTTLLRQQAFFADTHRVVNVDLRGHGESGSPEQIYSVARFADDIAWLCRELNVQRATVVGHSMGGAVALETAYRYPELVRAVGLIDSVFQAPAELLEMLASMLPDLQGSDYQSTYREIMAALSLPSDLAELSPILSTLPKTTRHVLLSALQQYMEAHDFARAAASCSVPVAYIGATRPLANLAQLKQLIPDIWIGQTLGRVISRPGLCQNR
jgi:pimeloyl-ACP methyl ester carboxylesterase